MAVETSIVVQFGTGVTGVGDIAIIEFDPEHENNLNTDGDVKSTFEPDDRPVFLVHLASHLQITDIKCTHGSVMEIGRNLIQQRENSSLFNLEGSVNSYGYALATNLASEWYGNVGVPVINASGIELDGGATPCYGDFTFDVNFDRQYMLVPPTLNLVGDETYSIYCVIYVDAI